MGAGVAVAKKKGAPLMRLFKANQPYQSEEDRARDARLTHIASRYRARPSNDLPVETQPQPPEDREPPL
jgi:hypothetical protein